MQSIYFIVKCQAMWHLPSSKQSFFISNTYGSMLLCSRPVLSIGAISYFVRENAPLATQPLAFSWKHIIWSTCIFVFGLQQRNHMKMTELPERMMTSLLRKHVNSWREQGRGAEKQEEEFQEENFALGLPTSSACCWEWLYLPFRINTFAP